MILRTSTSHEEGCDRQFEHPDQGVPAATKRATSAGLVTVQVEWITGRRWPARS